MKKITLLLAIVLMASCAKESDENLRPLKHTHQYNWLKTEVYSGGLLQNIVYNSAPMSESMYLNIKQDTIYSVHSPVQGQTSPYWNETVQPSVNTLLFSNQSPQVIFKADTVITRTANLSVYWIESNYNIN